ncbi:hypothetical protein FQN54_003893 [Arachnomyces sp. PD_36]|nr:hypothetical protein FQN54_003893 [Arachnomyces sp. PD_36]
MAGTKRSWEGEMVTSNDDVTMSNAEESPRSVQSIFENFRDELDEHHDRRERVVKASRDITASSKKVIFSLQRLRNINAPIPQSITDENSKRFTQITDLFNSISGDISGINGWRYQRQISPGIQEFIEAFSFDQYVRHQRLVSLQDVVEALPKNVLLTEEDYLLGLYDLTGEMMRFAVTAMATGGGAKPQNTDGAAGDENKGPGLPESQTAIVVDLRAMRAQFEGLNIPPRHGIMREVHKKVETMQASVEKVEKAAYGVLVRGSERPGGWVPDLSAPEVESY